MDELNVVDGKKIVLEFWSGLESVTESLLGQIKNINPSIRQPAALQLEKYLKVEINKVLTAECTGKEFVDQTRFLYHCLNDLMHSQRLVEAEKYTGNLLSSIRKHKIKAA